MPRKLLLLADDHCWGELRHVAGLPQRIWSDWQHSNPAADSGAEAVSIVRHDPGRIASFSEEAGSAKPTPNSAGRLDEEGRDELFAELLGSVVCHLVVLENKPNRNVSGSEDDPASHKEASKLGAVVRWYERFHEEAARRVARRQEDYRHVLILICADPMPAVDFKHLKRLTAGAGKDKLCDVCYVMWPQLELGPHDVCHARYVWPIAVTRLLLKLLEDKVDQTQHRTRTFAWRAFELAPGVDSVEVEQMFHSLLDDSFKSLRHAVERSEADWNSASFNPLPQSVDLVSLSPDKPIPRGEFWHTFNTEKCVRDIASPDRWEAELVLAGQEFAGRLKRRAVLEDAPASGEVQNVWSRVHTHPGYVPAALLDKNLIEAARIDDRFAEIAANWNSVAECEQNREAKLAEIRSCSSELIDAQSGFLEILFRIIAGGMATLVVSVLSMAVFYELLGSFWTAAIIALGSGIGALVAAFGTYYLERYRGEHARDVFIQMLKDVDNLTRARHEKCQTALVHATSFWERLRSRSLAGRLRQLLTRAQVILDHELQPEIPRIGQSESEVLDESGSPGDAQRDQRRRNQRARFLAKTSMLQAVEPDNLEPHRIRELAGINETVRNFQEQFIQDVWRRTCLEGDKGRLGKIPARILIPRIRDFQESFRAELVAEVHRQIIEQMHGTGVDLWASQIARLQNEPLFYYLSCPVSEDVAGTMHSILFVRHDFQPGSLAQHAGELAIVPSKPLSNLPLVGLLFQECPIEFVSENGETKVKHVA